MDTDKVGGLSGRHPEACRSGSVLGWVPLSMADDAQGFSRAQFEGGLLRVKTLWLLRLIEPEGHYVWKLFSAEHGLVTGLERKE